MTNATPLPIPLDRTGRRIRAALVGLVLFDLTLVIWVYGFPDLWWWAFHGVDRVDPQGLFERMGANWAAFLLCQLVALVRWRREPKWLLVVAGVRLSDIFTDVTYVIAADDKTWFAWATLPVASLANVILGLWLLEAWERVRNQLAHSRNS